MILLAIDTATECCSAALLVDGKVYHRSSVQPRLHAELILPFIDELLVEAGIKKTEIQGLVVAQGPGAFTGVRIGVSVAQGIAMALGVPVAAVSNLETLAFRAYQELHTTTIKTVLVATDARMNEVYWAKYLINGSKISLLSLETVGSARDVDIQGVDVYIGSGFTVYPELLDYAKKQPMIFDTNVFSQAKDMLLMVEENFNKLSVAIESVEPIYLREP